MRLSFGRQVLIASISGVLTGLFLGPFTAIIRPVGSIYAMLLQMAVVPYIFLSVILGLGSLTPPDAKKMLKNGWPFWILLWFLVLLFIYLFSQMIPKHAEGYFLQPPPSAGEIHETLAKNILSDLIPENPAYDFLNSIVPAIAVLGLIIGMALMHIEKKEPLLSLIDKGDLIIEKILTWLIRISPIGVFANIAVITGTVYLSDLIRIDFYAVSVFFITLLFLFWILPLVLSSLTPLSFRESLRAFGSVCTLAFAAGTSAIAIPLINRYLRKLSERDPFKGQAVIRATTQTVLPFSYSFAQIGNALFLFFMLFASFYYRHPFTDFEKFLLAFLTIPLPIHVDSIPLLLKELKFPENAVDLSSAVMPVAINFQALLSASGIFTLVLLVIFSNYPFMQIKWKSLLFKLIGSIALFGAIILPLRPFIHLKDNFLNLYPERSIDEFLKDPIKARVYLPGQPLDYLPSVDPGEIPLVRIFRTKYLRIGYSPYNIPYAYWNQKKELAGFDVAMAYQLAKNLNCQLEFIPMDVDHIADELNQGMYDIAMSAILITEDRIRNMSFTDTYTEQNNVLVVRKSKRQQFADLEDVQNNNHLIITAAGGYKTILSQKFPNAAPYHGAYELGIPTGARDAWLWSLIPGTIWCLSNPDFYIDDYNGQLGKSYFAYAVRSDAVRLLRFINNWLMLKKIDGFYQDAENYWIYGTPALKNREPRWSVVRNILHWVK